MHARSAEKLYKTITCIPHVLATNGKAAPHCAFSILPTGTVFTQNLIIFPFETFSPFAVLQSRAHELWARFFSSSLKDDLSYAPSQCFRTFPFPVRLRSGRRHSKP